MDYKMIFVVLIAATGLLAAVVGGYTLSRMAHGALCICLSQCF